MNLKTSLYNKAVFNTNFRRFAFIFAIYLFVSEVIMDYFYLGFRYISSIENMGNPIYLYDFIDEMGMYYLFTITPLSVIMSIVFFHYIQKEKALTTLHSMPVSRKSIYFSNYALFTTLMSATLFLHFLFVSLHLTLGKGLPAGEVFGVMGVKFLTTLLLALTVFAFTTLIGMIVSNFILQGALVMLLFGLPFVLARLVDVLLETVVIGYYSVLNGTYIDFRISPYYFLADLSLLYKNPSGGNLDPTAFAFNIDKMSIILSLATLLISFVLGYVLYKKRDLERCRDFIVFGWAKHALIALITILASLILANMLGIIGRETGAGNYTIYIGAFVGALLGYIIMKLISEKSVSILKFVPKGLICGAAALVILFVVDMDVFGYERYMPSPDKVEVAYVGFSDNLDFMEEAYGRIWIGNSEIAKLSGADIEILEQRQAQILEDIRTRDNSDYYSAINIFYILDSGKVVHRKYRINEEYFANLMDEFIVLDSNKMFLSENYDVKTSDGNLQSPHIYGDNGVIFDLEEDDYKELLKEYKKDYLYYLCSNREDAGEGIVTIVSYSKMIDENMEDINFVIHDKYTNSIKWLEENGYASILVPEEDEINESDLKIYSIGVYNIDENGDENLLFSIRDANRIAEISNINFEASADSSAEFKPLKMLRFWYGSGENREIYLTEELLDGQVGEELLWAIERMGDF